MANTEDTFDPNDLESIDALLDEAELEAVSDDSELDSLDGSDISDDSWGDLEAQTADLSNDATAIDEIGNDTSDVDSEDILDSLDDLEVSSEESLEEVEQVTEDLSADAEAEVVAVSQPLASEKIKPQQKDMSAVEDDAAVDDFLAKRAKASTAKSNNLSVEDMESIKKLIVIFGSVLSVLVLVAIGIGVWSALAASSAGVDDETKTLIESIKVSSEQNGGLISENEKMTASVEKKLDAINFQIEQMMTDLSEMDQKKQTEIIDPLGLGQPSKAVETKTVTTETAKPTSAAVNNPELMSKISTVSSRLYRAQQRIDEVNQRLKVMQKQSSDLTQSMKMLEKEALLHQAERDAKAAKLAEQKKQKQQNPYNYSAPEGGFYDQSVSDSYP